MITINGIAIDAALTETHGFESEVTQYPVESGSMITDNVRPKPITLEIEGLVSDNPLPGPVADARGLAIISTNTVGGVSIDYESIANVPSDTVLAQLRAIYEAREPITVTSALKTYDNMVMTSLSVPRDADTGHALHFTATFQQVIFVTNNRTTIEVAPPQQTGLGAKKDFGNKVVFDLTDSASVWHHSAVEVDDAGVAHSGIEPLGTNNKDLRDGKAGLYHVTGAPLNDDELDQYNQDEAAWARTHDEQGNALPQPSTVIQGYNPNGLSTNGTSNLGGTTHSTEAVFQQGDGTWVDSQGHPVTYNSTYGNWLETGDK